MQPSTSRVIGPQYELFVLALSLFALAILATETFFSLDEESQTILQYADLGVCVVFLADFFKSLAQSSNRLKYFFSWGWLDLISSIPVVDALRLGRTARIVRVLRVLRSFRATRMLLRAVLSRKAESAFLAALLVSFFLVIFSSLAILQFENAEASNIKNAEDALWWSWTTITTVGYGDKFPVTSEGRFIGVVLMTTGVGLFGTLSGLIASWFLAPDSEAQENEFEVIRQELRVIRELLEPSTSSKRVFSSEVEVTNGKIQQNG